LAKNRLAPLEAGEKEKVKADEIARNTKSFKGHYLRASAWTTAGTLVVTPNKIQFMYRPDEKPTVFQCSDMSAAKLEGVFVRDIHDPDGQGTMRFEAESVTAANDALTAMRYVCANPGKNFSDSAVRNSDNAAPVDPNAKVFSGYLGIMSAGFTARPGKMVIAASGIQFVWDKGTAGVADNNKAVDFKLHPDPPTILLQCSYFTTARTDGFFIREINTSNPAVLVEVTGWGGAVLRFKGSSPTEAANVLAAVRESCKNH
jgi:hypothetical protein